MKRSEAIKSLEGFLTALDASVEPMNYNEKAKAIFKLLEESIGMSPPNFTIFFKNKILTTESSAKQKVNSWEPECHHCGSYNLPIQKMSGLVCADCRKVI